MSEQQNVNRNRRILVIDDNQAIHADFRKVFAQTNAPERELADVEADLFGDSTCIDETADFEIDSAFQGQEGLEKIRQAHHQGSPYAMAFVDVRMPPGWDGIETIDRVWQEFPDLQIVICTAYSDYSWKQITSKLRKKENLLILKKPFDATEVLQMACALTEKWALARMAGLQLHELERNVQERTRDLENANSRLRDEITQRIAAESRLRYEAFHDSLTELPNRALLQDRLQGSIDRVKRTPDHHFGVLFFDLDRFKMVNDSLGHEFGDRLLCAASARIKESVRCSDSVSRFVENSTVARLGGDEFVILLDNIKQPWHAATVAERLLEGLGHPYQLGEHTVRVTASIGVVVYNETYSKADEMLRDADTAMYQAKARGGACFVMFDSSMQTAIQNRLQIENDMRNGIGTDQFYLNYQPIVGLEHSTSYGVEALVRWNHPSRGPISPGEFIPIAEETRLIMPMSEWILKQACIQFMDWQRKAPELAPSYISVNLSRVQLTKDGLVDQIVDIVRDAGMSPDQLQLEVTESLIMEDPKLAKQTLNSLKNMGVRLAIDDFGTGHSALACLYEFKFDVLKIDRSFIANFEQGNDYIALANSVVKLANNLSMDCVAEGVEEKYQATLLGQMGCEYVQGYFFGRPMSAGSIIEGAWRERCDFDCAKYQSEFSVAKEELRHSLPVL